MAISNGEKLNSSRGAGRQGRLMAAVTYTAAPTAAAAAPPAARVVPVSVRRTQRRPLRLPLVAVTSIALVRPPKLTVLRRSIKRVWFLLHRGQFRTRPVPNARAVLSTGVLTLRRTAGELA